MITLSNFENYALPQIWERGISYYRQGAVRNLEEDSPEEWVATVLGTEDYTVEVTLEDDKVMDYICDCPYEGDMCKHVVATLLTIRERKKTEKYFIKAEETESKSRDFSSETVKAEINEILAIADKKQLMSFLSEYAVHHVDFRNALKQQFIPDRNTESLDTDYCQEVERCFLSSPSGSGYGRSGRRYSYEVDLNEISRKLSVYEKKAEFLMKQKSFGDAASIFIQVLRSIGKHYKEDSYYASYDNDFALSDDCYMAGEGLMSLGNNQEVPQSLKDDILKSLDEICDLSAYTEYCIYEIEELRDEFEMNALPLTKVLERVEKELAGLDESDAGLPSFVNKKIDLLYLLDRNEEAEATTMRYLFLPEIRNLRVDDLIDAEKYEEALSTLEEGIRLEEQGERSYNIHKWKNKKLIIYQRMQDIPHVISTAKDLFIEKKGNMDYYRLLKQLIPVGEWDSFFSELIEQTPFPASCWTSSVEADIYVEEGDVARLENFLRRNSSLNVLLIYSRYLKDDYPEDLLERFSSQVQVYADKSTGRSHYEYVAKALKEMLKLKGGEQEVRLLVDVFRQAYKRRTAMMGILKDF